MIVAVTVTAVGVFAVGLITQLFGYRIGGDDREEDAGVVVDALPLRADGDATP